MPSKFMTSKTAISIQSEVFSYSELYLFLKKTMQERGYYIEEKSYTHNSSKPTESVDFYWKCGKRVDDFTMFQIEIIAKIRMEDVAIIKNKKKEIANKGGGTIKVRSTLITDYAGKWEESNPIIAFAKVLFENIFQKGSVDEYTKKLTDESYEIENEIKSYFKLQRMM